LAAVPWAAQCLECQEKADYESLSTSDDMAIAITG
jgi:RNA polymerase-binding transcription factor DksA